MLLHFVLPYALLRPGRPQLREGPAAASTAEELRWEGTDGFVLVADRYSIRNPRGRFVVVHGIGSRKEEQAGLCRFLNERGFEVIAVDLRAHGASEGEFCTFGFHEKQDLAKLLDTYPSGVPTFTWGASLGGAVTLQWMENDGRVRDAIVASAFATLEEMALDRVEQILGLRWSWIADYLLWRGGVRVR